MVIYPFQITMKCEKGKGNLVLDFLLKLSRMFVVLLITFCKKMLKVWYKVKLIYGQNKNSEKL